MVHASVLSDPTVRRHSWSGGEPRPEDNLILFILTFVHHSMPFPEPQSSACFSGDAEVQVLGSGTTHVKDLKVGQKVLTGDGSFSKVCSSGHKNPSSKVTYLQVLTKSMGKNCPLEISHEHLIYTQDQVTKETTIVPASELKVGDLLLGSADVPRP